MHTVPPTRAGAEALALIAQSGLPAQVRAEMVDHVAELLTERERWLTGVVSGWIRRERDQLDQDDEPIPMHEGWPIHGRSRS